MSLTSARLDQLAERGEAAILALWAEARADVAPLARRGDPLFCLQRASLLAAAGNIGAAAAEIEAAPEGLPRGLAGCRDELLAALATAARVQPARHGEELTGPAAPFADTGREGADSGARAVSLETWLTQVKGWREILSV